MTCSLSSGTGCSLQRGGRQKAALRGEGPADSTPACKIIRVPEKTWSGWEPPSCTLRAPGQGLGTTRLTSTRGHAVGDHGWTAHGVEAVVSIVGTHMAVQSLGWGPRWEVRSQNREKTLLQSTRLSTTTTTTTPGGQLEGEVVTGNPSQPSHF
jgi:hypothetical protein